MYTIENNCVNTSYNIGIQQHIIVPLDCVYIYNGDMEQILSRENWVKLKTLLISVGIA